MDELIFFGIIIFFSIIESIARSRKAKRRKEEGEEDGADPGHEFEWAQGSPADLPTYDSAPSYDDQPSYDDAVEDAPVHRGGSPRDSGRPSSETLLPGDLLAELTGLAGRMEKEREKARTISLPKQSPPLPQSGDSRSEVSTEWAEGARGDRSGRAVSRAPRSPAPARTTTVAHSRAPRPPVEHRIHLSHAGYGTDPSERAKSEQDDLDPLREFLSEDAKAVRNQLMSQSESSLRQAIILREVLGPPVALRDE